MFSFSIVWMGVEYVMIAIAKREEKEIIKKSIFQEKRREVIFLI